MRRSGPDFRARPRGRGNSLFFGVAFALFAFGGFAVFAFFALGLFIRRHFELDDRRRHNADDEYVVLLLGLHALGQLQVADQNLVAIHDELDLQPGQLRLKSGGGDNGHNGLKSLRSHLGTGDFLRIRVGIGRPQGRQSSSDYVLAKLRSSDADAMRVDAAVAADAAEHLVQHGLVSAQNAFNS